MPSDIRFEGPNPKPKPIPIRNPRIRQTTPLWRPLVTLEVSKAIHRVTTARNSRWPIGYWMDGKCGLRSGNQCLEMGHYQLPVPNTQNPNTQPPSMITSSCVCHCVCMCCVMSLVIQISYRIYFVDYPLG